MFAKLLKHEWRGSVRTLGPLSLAAVGVGLLGGLIIKLMDRLSVYEDAMPALMIGLVLLLFAVVTALFAYNIAVQIILVVGFYRSRFTDRGYLTFTLPVKTEHIFLSCAVNMMIWTVISTLTMLLAGAVMAAFGISSLKDTGVFDLYSRLFDEVSSIYGQVYDTRGYALAALANGAVTFVYGPFMTLTSLTIGAVAAKKHKIIAAFATYYIISVIVSIVSTVVQTAMTIAAFASDKAPSMAAAQLPQIFAQLVFIVLGYLISVHLMKNSLNLP